MFYCKKCRKKDWPRSAVISFGPCELCGHLTNCYDFPSKYLGIKGKTKMNVKEELERIISLNCPRFPIGLGLATTIDKEEIGKLTQAILDAGYHKHRED